jgi:hypothetical protein
MEPANNARRMVNAMPQAAMISRNPKPDFPPVWTTLDVMACLLGLSDSLYALAAMATVNPWVEYERAAAGAE